MLLPIIFILLLHLDPVYLQTPPSTSPPHLLSPLQTYLSSLTANCLYLPQVNYFVTKIPFQQSTKETLTQSADKPVANGVWMMSSCKQLDADGIFCSECFEGYQLINQECIDVPLESLSNQDGPSAKVRNAVTNNTDAAELQDYSLRFSATSAQACSNGYVYDGRGSCILIGSNCLTYTSCGTCLQCRQNSMNIKKVCRPTTVTSLCQDSVSKGNTSNCTSCSKFAVKDIFGNCIQKDPNCEQRKDGYCVSCKKGFLLSSGQCVKIGFETFNYIDIGCKVWKEGNCIQCLKDWQFVATIAGAGTSNRICRLKNIGKKISLPAMRSSLPTQDSKQQTDQSTDTQTVQQISQQDILLKKLDALQSTVNDLKKFQEVASQQQLQLSSQQNMQLQNQIQSLKSDLKNQIQVPNNALLSFFSPMSMTNSNYKVTIQYEPVPPATQPTLNPFIVQPSQNLNFNLPTNSQSYQSSPQVSYFQPKAVEPLRAGANQNNDLKIQSSSALAFLHSLTPEQLKIFRALSESSSSDNMATSPAIPKMLGPNDPNNPFKGYNYVNMTDAAKSQGLMSQLVNSANPLTRSLPEAPKN